MDDVSEAFWSFGVTGLVDGMRDLQITWEEMYAMDQF